MRRGTVSLRNRRSTRNLHYGNGADALWSALPSSCYADRPSRLPIANAVPDWLSWDFWAKDSQSLNHLALIIAGVIGIPLLAIRTFAANKSAKAADAQARTAEQGHITDRFTAAVEQLGSEKMAVRLGAIYALERISRDSRRDYWTIMETLTAYVREHALWPPRHVTINPFIEFQRSSAVEKTGRSNRRTKRNQRVSGRPRTFRPFLPSSDVVTRRRANRTRRRVDRLISQRRTWKAPTL